MRDRDPRRDRCDLPRAAGAASGGRRGVLCRSCARPAVRLRRRPAAESWFNPRRMGESHVDWVPPERFDEYRLLRALGRGSMGQVWLAHDTVLDRLVAVKFISDL